MLGPAMLKLLRYSQMIALAVLFAVVLALSLLYRGLLFDSLVESETDASVALSKTFANAIWPSHARFVTSARASACGRWHGKASLIERFSSSTRTAILTKTWRMVAKVAPRQRDRFGAARRSE